MFGISNGQTLFTPPMSNDYNNNTHTTTNNLHNNTNNDISNIFTRNLRSNVKTSLLIENKPEDTKTNNYYNYNNSENSDRSSEHSEYSKHTTNSQNSIDELKNTIDSFKKDIDELKNLIKLQIKVNSNKSNGIYIKCNLHEHLLKETIVNDLLDVYNSGFVCDNCNYKQHNINEKFYHCQECNSVSGIGNYDLCVECVKKHF